MCRRHWTVVDHSLYTAMLAERDGQPVSVQLACLLHDAHEWTGDIPTHFKTHSQREMQHFLDGRIFDEYMPPSVGEWGTIVKEYDHRALLAEALVVGPPSFKTSDDVLEHFGERPRLRDVVALVKRLESGELGVDPSELTHFSHARNAYAFIRKLRQLSAAITEASTASSHSVPKGFDDHEIKGRK